MESVVGLVLAKILLSIVVFVVVVENELELFQPIQVEKLILSMLK